MTVGNLKIRVFNGYGPQEDDSSNKIDSFWQTMGQEIVNAKEEGCLIIIQMDANTKIGRALIKEDPHLTSNNGKILLDIVRVWLLEMLIQNVRAL